jgi:hypothetical protein
MEENFVGRLWALLHRPTLAKTQYRPKRGTAAYGRAERIGLADFRKHMTGVKTLAVSCLRLRKALFIAFDIDARFNERLCVIKGVLKQRGIASAAFAIEGTDAGRGKIVLTFKEPIPQAQAVTLANDILREAQADLFFGASNGDVTVFPNHGMPAGNTVRLFGINLRRGSGELTEAPQSLDGELSDLWYVTPADIGAEAAPEYHLIPGYDGTLQKPYAGNGATVAGDMMSAAWRSPSREVFEAWCDRAAQSTGLSSGAREQLGRADVRLRTWRKVEAQRDAPRDGIDRLGSWQPLAHPPAGLKATSPAWKVYVAAANLAVSLKRNPHCFAITYGQWADLCGYTSKSACGKAVIEAEKRGLLIRIDRGDATLGGFPTMIALVGRGETAEQAFQSGYASDEYRRRRDARAAVKKSPRGNWVEDGIIKYCPRAVGIAA